jgi:hypothetical protein
MEKQKLFCCVAHDPYITRGTVMKGGGPHITYFIIINNIIWITTVNIKLTLEVLSFHISVSQYGCNRFIGKPTRKLVITSVSKCDKTSKFSLKGE